MTPWDYHIYGKWWLRSFWLRGCYSGQHPTKSWIGGFWTGYGYLHRIDDGMGEWGSGIRKSEIETAEVGNQRGCPPMKTGYWIWEAPYSWSWSPGLIYWRHGERNISCVSFGYLKWVAVDRCACDYCNR